MSAKLSVAVFLFLPVFFSCKSSPKNHETSEVGSPNLTPDETKEIENFLDPEDATEQGASEGSLHWNQCQFVTSLCFS